MIEKNSNEEKSSYEKLHRPASEFATRSEYLDNELKIMAPKRWALNLPRKDFNFEQEDLVPALAGTIGKVVLTTAIVGAYATAIHTHLGIYLPPGFVVENVRFEMLIAILLFVIPISGFINPRVNLPGCHGPMVPLIGLIIAAGGHPLAIGVLLGVFGLILSAIKGGSRLVDLTGISVRGGLLIVLGYIGLMGQMTALRAWAVGIGMELVFFVVIAVNLIVYSWQARVGKRWLAIPMCSIVSVIIALAMGVPFQFRTSPGIPELNPLYWWGVETGWMLGLPGIEHFIASLPFALLSVAMWPPDFLSHKIFQEMNYPKGSEKAMMDIDDTMTNCSFRQMVGSLLGGGNLTSSWGTYIIPAGIAKRPIPAGAILLGIFCVITVLLGFPMDIAIWPPVLRVALIVGVFIPLLEAGMAMIQTKKDAEGAGIVIFSSLLVNPVFGWALSMLLDNCGLINPERAKELRPIDRYVIPGITLIVCTGIMAVTGMIPGIPPML